MAPDTEWTEAELSGPKIDRRTAISLLGAAGLGGMAGCTGGEGTETASETDGDGTASATATPPPEDQFGGRLQAGWFTGEIEQMDPPYISVGQYFQLSANVFSGLTTLEPDLTVRGDLAEDWTVEDGGATFTFQLRDDVTFHNGEEFTAETFATRSTAPSSRGRPPHRSSRRFSRSTRAASRS